MPSADTPRIENIPDGGGDPTVTQTADKFAFKPAGIESAPKPLDDKEAYEQTETLMDMRETVQALGIAMYADGTMKTNEQYHYEPWQKELLIKAWMPIIRDSGLRVSPWIKVLYAEGISATPLIGLAMQNRKNRLEAEQLRAENAKLREQVAKGEKPPVNAGTTSQRRDTAKHWKVDKNGYFMYTIANGYILENNRTEKPSVKEHYEMLCKHNGKPEIDKIFKL